MGDFKPIFIQQGDIEYFFEFFVVVITNIRIRSLRMEKVVTLFPYTDRVGLYTRQVFKIFDGECVHEGYNKDLGQLLYKLISGLCFRPDFDSLELMQIYKTAGIVTITFDFFGFV